MLKSSIGRSHVEILAVIACIAICGSMASALLGQQKDPAAAPNTFRTHPDSLKDSTQMRLVHQSWIVYARENKAKFPTPGLINRQAMNGQHIPGVGPEEVSLNTTANLYSACIAQNYFTPELVISPVERNPNVKVNTDYDYAQYNPAADIYWDARFVADLEKKSNVSYAHMPIAGERQKKEWADTMNALWPIVGNRGPKGGERNPDSHTCGPHGNWAGYICFQDNHFDFFTAVPGVDDDNPADNIFAPDTKGALLTFTKAFENEKPVLQFD